MSDTPDYAVDLPYAVRAEVRAVEQGHKSYVGRNGTYRVVSDTRAGVAYTVTPYLTDEPGAWVFINCTCPASARSTRSRLCPCKHAALVGRRLEREGKVVYDPALDGWVVPGERPVPTDEEIRAVFRSVALPYDDLLESL